jgi:nucleotide-binding universal stress UspA family protein
MTFQHVLVAIDGSECAAHALEVAASLAAAVGAQIGVVHVIDPRLVGSETGVPADQQWAILRTDAKALLDTAASTLAGPAPCWKFVREGTPWAEIVESARTWPADLLVIGTHGRSGLTRLVFGSTAEGVTRHAPCPVVVVPPASGKGHAS